MEIGNVFIGLNRQSSTYLQVIMCN